MSEYNKALDDASKILNQYLTNAQSQYEGAKQRQDKEGENIWFCYLLAYNRTLEILSSLRK